MTLSVAEQISARKRTGDSNAAFGRYRIVQRIGCGGMGVLDLAADPSGRLVGLKRLLPGLVGQEHFRRLLLEEARIGEALSHPGLVSFIEHGTIDGEPYLAYDYVDGISAQNLLTALGRQGERLGLGAAGYIGLEVLDVLDYVHRARDSRGRSLGIVHRDVSPSNILVERTGHIRLLDFGIALCGPPKARAELNDIKGKLGYMSPEQILGDAVDARSDLFVLAATLVELITGRPLFQKENGLDTAFENYGVALHRLDYAALPRPVDTVLRRALECDPRARFQSARDFHRNFDGALRSSGLNPSASALEQALYRAGLLPSSSGVFVKPSLRPPSTPSPAARGAPTPSPAPRCASTNPTTAPGLCRIGKIYRVHKASSGDARPVERPCHIEAIVELLATRRLTGADRVAVAGEPFQPIASEPLLGPYLLRGLQGVWRDPVLPPSYRCPVARRPVAGMLAELMERRFTGLCVVNDGMTHRRVHLQDGEPVASASTEAHQLLGARLRKAGLLTEEQLALAVRFSLAWGCRIGRALVRLQLVNPAVIVRALVDQLEDRVVELAGSQTGEALIFEGERAPTDEPRLPARALEQLASQLKTREPTRANRRRYDHGR